MRPLRRGVAPLAIVASLLAFGCTDPPATPSTNAPFSQTDLVLGNGSTATSGGTLTVDYTGWFYDVTKSDQKGLQFDSSIGQAPFTFVLGSGQVIRGWDQGVAGMRVGGERRRRSFLRRWPTETRAAASCRQTRRSCSISRC